MEPNEMLPRMVYTITYECNQRSDDEDDRGTIDAFWTGEIDTWGKRTLHPVDGSPTIYLFDHEIVEIEP